MRGRCLAAVVAVGLCASSAMAAEGYELLFKDATSKLSREDKQQVFEALGFRLSKNKRFLIDDTCGKGVSPTVRIDDLNGDGVQEVFVVWGNVCTSGRAGASVSLFVKDASGRYIGTLGFPAIGYEMLATGSKAFPDLRFGGPGFCHGVWRWDGTAYQHLRDEPETAGGCDAVKQMNKGR